MVRVFEQVSLKGSFERVTRGIHFVVSAAVAFVNVIKTYITLNLTLLSSSIDVVDFF